MRERTVRLSDEGYETLGEYLTTQGMTLGAFLEAWSEYVAERTGSYTGVTNIERRVVTRAKEIDSERRRRS
jgi:hypothetical protein